MNILVTGGAGYIGSILTEELLKEGQSVVVYDNFSHGHREAIAPSAEVIEGDISDRQKLEGIFKRTRIDAVMHLAALIEAGESMKVPEIYFRNNSASTLGLLEAMLACGVNKFVFSSTAALYGEPERIPIEETDPLKPTNAYGQSKLLVEQMLSWFNRIHGFRYASLRYFNAAGASKKLGEDHHPESHLIPLILAVAAGKRENVSIYGTDYPTEDGTCVRDYIHVLDIANAHLLALEALASHDHLIYNLGNGEGFSVRQVLDVARRITKHPIAATEVPRRAGDPAVLVASSQKIQRELGWKSHYPDLESIVDTAWQWQRHHPDGYSS